MASFFYRAVIPAFALSVLAPAGHSQAKDNGAALPGVDLRAGDTVVKVKKPQPVPAADQDDWVRMGKWDVKMSGKIVVDVGAGPHPLNNR